MQPSLDELRLHLRLSSLVCDNSDYKNLLTNYLKVACVQAEHFIGRYIEKSSFTLTDDFTQTVTLEGVDKNYFPLIEVTSVKVDSTTLTTDQYSVSGNVLTFSDSVTGESIEIIWTAGGRTVEEDIRAAILLMAARLFNNPVDSVETLPTQSQALLKPYRKWGL